MAVSRREFAEFAATSKVLQFICRKSVYPWGIMHCYMLGGQLQMQVGYKINKSKV